MESLKQLTNKLKRGAFAKDSTNEEGRIVVTTPDTAVCPSCFDTRTALDANGRGTLCKTCLPEREAHRRKVLLEKVPPRYQGTTLETMQPRPDLHPDQAKHIAFMLSRPEVNYYICGRNDTGKTLFLYALYDHAVRAGRNVFVATLFEIIESVKRGFNDPREARKVFGLYMADLDQRRFPYSVFIDDADKARPTEFVAEVFFDLVDRIYKHQHQLVVTSQLDTEALADHFERAHDRYGVGITRRIVNDETAILRMF